MLVQKEKTENIIWGIWEITETTDELLSSLNHTGFAQNITSEKRLTEQAAVRVLLKILAKEEKIIEYTEEGKPYLSDRSYNISISHTKGYAAVILSAEARVGIDIEYISDKVKRVRSRFISKDEYIDENNDLIHLLLHWSAKETMYKAIGCTGVDFIQHLKIDKFEISESGHFSAHEKFTVNRLSFNIQYFVEEDYVLTLIY